MQRVLKFTKQYQKSFVRSNTTTFKKSDLKSFEEPVKVFYGADAEANRLTNENIKKEMEGKFGPAPEYSKKGDFDVSVLSKIKEILSYKSIESEEFFNVVKEAGGYESVQQVKDIYSDTGILDFPLPKIPSYTSKPLDQWSQDTSDIKKADPKTVEKFLSGLSSSEKDEWNTLFKAVDEFEKDHYSIIEKKLPQIDWAKAEKVLGEEVVFNHREKLHNTLNNLLPTYDKDEALKLFASYVVPEVSFFFFFCF